MGKRSNNNSEGRRHYGEKPYDVSNSFVKKMATKVTDLIPQRSWISKWFNSPGGNDDISNNGNHSEEETQEPPSKRPRIRMDMTHPAGTFTIQPRNRVSDENRESSSQQYLLKDDILEDIMQPSMTIGSSSTPSFVASTPAINNEVHNSIIPGTNGIDDNSESAESTTGCSTLVPQTNRQELLATYVNLPFANRKGPVNNKLTHMSYLQSPRSLIIDTRESMNSRKPNFNASAVSNSSNSTEPGMTLSSPFYSGNTTFGGANAIGNFRQGRGHAGTAYEFQLKVPRRTSIRVKPTNVSSNVSDSSGMSQTAKRILEALEHFSSPIIDAKKIPIKSPVSVFSVGKKRARNENIGPISRVGLRHLTRELAVPTVPDMLKLKRRQRLQDTTLAARKIVSAHSEPPPATTVSSTCHTIGRYYLKEENDSSKFFGKLRAKSKKKPDLEETVVTVNLSDMPLPITNLPSFDISLPISNGNATNTKTISTSNSPPKYQDNYKFSSPIKFSETSKNLKSINNFTFSKPINADCEKINVGNSSIMKIPSSINSTNVSFPSGQPMANFVWAGSSTAPRPKEKTTQYKSDGMSEKTKIAMELVSGSVMDILGKKCNNRDTNIWECNECFIKNNANEEQCVACKARMPDSTKNISSTINNVTSSIGENDTQFGTQCQINIDKWECNFCLVRNAHSQSKCIACMASRHEPDKEYKSSSSVALIATSTDLMEKFRSPTDCWECPGCMLKNPPDVLACPCCSASKPGLVKTHLNHSTELKANTTNENETLTNVTSSIKKSNSWECPTCMVRNDSIAPVCICCTTPCPKNKSPSLMSSSSSVQSSSSSSSTSSTSSSSSSPSASSNELTHIENTSKITGGFGDKFKKPEGAWSCDTCMVQNKSDAIECIACGGLKSNKIDTAIANPKSKTPTVNSALQFHFGIPSNESKFPFETGKTKENKSTTKTNGFTFGVPTTQQSNQIFTFGISNTEKEITIGSANTIDGTANELNRGYDTVGDTKVISNETSTINSIFGTPKTASDKLSTSDMSEKSTLFIFGTSTTQSTAGNNNGGTSTNTTKNKEIPLTNSQATIMHKFSNVEIPITTTFSFVAPASAGIATKDNGINLSTSSATSSSIGAMPFTFSAPKSSSPENSSIIKTEVIPSAATSKTTVSSGFSFTNPKFTEIAQSKTLENKDTISFGDTSKLSSAYALANVPVTRPVDNIAETKTAPLHYATSEDTKIVSFVNEEKVQTFDVIESKISAFGDSNICKSSTDIPPTHDNNKHSVFNTTKSTFGSGESPALPQFRLSNSASNIFGSGSSSNYGTQHQQTQSARPNIFSAAKTISNTNQSGTPSLFTFGAPSPQLAPQTSSESFKFSASHDATSSSTSKPMFNFGSSTVNTCQSVPAVTTFGTPNFSTTSGNPPSSALRFAFNAPKLDGRSGFGQPSTSIMPNIFGNNQTSSSLGQSTPATSFSSPTAGTSGGFSFGAQTPVTGPTSNTVLSGFNFSAAGTPATPSVGFNFNTVNSSPAITFDPNTRPTFNFTGGSTPPMFNATPQPVGRKIKKAVRRIPPRT